MMSSLLRSRHGRFATDVPFTPGFGFFCVLFMGVTNCRLIEADEPIELIRRLCVDCHGAPDESPEGAFALSPVLESTDVSATGPALKKALDAIEAHEMPPRESDQPSDEERAAMAELIRCWLAQPTRGDDIDAGRPLLRRLTRLEYNNTVRDLLGLETDLFICSERLPFERNHFRPSDRSMPDRVVMGAREYGAKYPVLLRDESLPGDSRAEYGFTNRGDAQNVSPVRLQQYVRLAGEIAFHPELLTRAERMQELFPNARFRKASSRATEKPKPLTSTGVDIASNGNVHRTVDTSSLDLEAFRERLASAYAEDRGGLLNGEEIQNTKIAGKGGLVRVAYGKNAVRVFAINPNEDWWFAPFATAEESSGTTLFANYRKKQKAYELTFQSAGSGGFAGIAEIGLVALSRRGESGTINLTATLDNDKKLKTSVTLREGAGADNTFVSFSAGDDRHIKRLAIDGSKFSGDYVLFDDLAFITRDKPNRQALVQAEEPVVVKRELFAAPQVVINRELAKRPASERLEHFLRRAFRREVDPNEVDTFVDMYDAELKRGGSEETAMRAALQGVLASPSFLYRIELGQSPSEPHQTVVALTDHELASRLSYFLWSTMPDDELLTAAANGSLQGEAALEAQTRRMLADVRSIELSENFFVQWMKLPELWSAQPDKRQFRSFYSAINDKRTLARDMFGQLLLLFQTIHAEDRPVTDLLHADYEFVNGKIAALHSLSVDDLATYQDERPLKTDELKDDRHWFRVRQTDPRRGGIITSPAMLTLTSFPHRTSSIRRGVWILDTVFNRHPPAPKIAVADIDAQANTDDLTLREKVEMHRENSACAVCHDRIDPPGFALENYDAIGRWRDKDGDEVIDPSGVLPGVGTFNDPVEFKEALLVQKRRFVQGLAEHLLSFAIGRELHYFDVPTVDAIVQATIEDDCRFSRLIVEIVKSHPFRNIRAPQE